MSEDKEQKLKNLEIAKENLNNNSFNIYIFVPDTEGVASAAVYELYYHAYVLRNAGYGVYMISEKEDYQIPDYLDEVFHSIPHTNAEKGDVDIAPHDFVIISEFFTNIMEQIKQLPCSKIVFAQSYDYSINALMPGMKWSDFGIRNVITTNEKLKEKIKELHGDIYNIQTYTIGIPDYFKPAKFKKPKVVFFTRNATDSTKIIKQFYLKYRDLSWVSFEDLRNTTRKEFAEKMSDSAFCLWVDKIAGFGTPPLEAMKCNTIPIAYTPEVIPSYMEEDHSGLWTADYYEIPDLIAKSMYHFLEDKLPENIYKKMDKIASKYSPENSEKEIKEIYNDFIEKRKKAVDNFIDEEKQNEKENNGEKQELQEQQK